LVVAGKAVLMRTLKKILVSVLFILLLDHAIYSANSSIIRVLIISGRNNHEWQKTTPALSRILQESGRFTVTVLNDPNQIDSDLLQFFDVIVSNWSAWPEAIGARWNFVTERAITDFIEKGKGFVLFHEASATHQDWPEYQKMAGMAWDMDKTGRSDIHTFKVTIKDKNNPITKGMPDFWIKDEMLFKLRPVNGVEVLCSATCAKDKRGSGKEESIATCTNFGAGRCFYNALGHDEIALENLAWKILMMRGIEWAATGQVTIEIPSNWPEWNEENS